MARGHFKALRRSLPGVVAIQACTGHAYPRHMHAQFGIGTIVHGAQRSASGRGPWSRRPATPSA